MPWEATMDQRFRAVIEVVDRGASKAGVCEAFGISRPTLDKWLGRYEAEGPEGLRDRSRAPRRVAHAVPPEIEARIVAFRRAHPDRGPRKIKAELERSYPNARFPAASTIGELLRRHGLCAPRKRRRRAEPHTAPFAACTQPNDVWCIDFKGWFRTGDGKRCDPLTVSDGATRFLIRCVHVPRTDYAGVRPVLEAAFRQYGLPSAIRSDNGAPFATRAPRGLSRLSIWWRKLGITPERIAPGKPEQNGRHERMHLTLKQCTAAPPQASLRAQQRAFQRFVHDYNHCRPHEALGQRPPGEVYEPSPRPYPRRVRAPEYPECMATRIVDTNGVIYWKGARVFITEALGRETVGLLALDGRYYGVYFGTLALGVLDEAARAFLHGNAGQRILNQKEHPY